MFYASRCGLGKLTTAAMLADGVDVDDATAVQAWVGTHNARLRPKVP